MEGVAGGFVIAVTSYSRRLDQLAAAHPDRAAVIFSTDDGEETTLSWAALTQRSLSLAHALAGQGVGVGGFLAIGLPNCPEHYVATLAAWRLGACALPVNAGMPAQERDEILALVRPQAVVSDWPDVPGLSRRDVVDAHEDLTPLPDVVPAPGKAVCSGGSTGRPKVIVDPQPLAVDETAEGLFDHIGMRDGQTTLVCGALFHNAPYSSSLAGLVRGHTLVLMDSFDAARAVGLIESHRVEYFFMAPTMMQRIVRLPGISAASFRSVQAMYHTAAPCPEWLKRRWLELLGPEKVYEAFGSTEALGATVIRGDEWLQRPGSVGRAVGCDLMILGDDGTELPAGETGEVFMRPHSSLPTYSYVGSDPARSTEDGYASVGDLGRLDADGYLYLADRRADLIITGGVNVYPAQVEAALTEHPAVRDAAVIGVPDDEWGQRVHAVVQATDPARPPATADLDRHVRERLAAYKVPKSFEFLDDFPRDAAGKLRRSALLDEVNRRSLTMAQINHHDREHDGRQ